MPPLPIIRTEYPRLDCTADLHREALVIETKSVHLSAARGRFRVILWQLWMAATKINIQTIIYKNVFTHILF